MGTQQRSEAENGGELIIGMIHSMLVLGTTYVHWGPGETAWGVPLCHPKPGTGKPSI